MKIAQLSVNRPVTVSMVVITVLILGFISLTRLSVDLLPEMNLPVAAVATTYDGAGPQEVESLVSRPLEEAMATLGNVTNVSSVSQRGQSLVIVEFDWGTDMDFATLEMRERVDAVRGLLPDGTGSPSVLKFDPSAQPIMQFGMGGSRSETEIKYLADELVKTRLERIDGVASVGVSGGLDEQVHVLVNPSAMRNYGVTFDGIVQALQGANLNLPGGVIETGQRELTVRTTGEFQSVEDIASVTIHGQGGSLSLSDIATVRMGFSDINQYTRLNQQPSIGLTVVKETGANSVEVARRVYAAINELKAQLGDDIDFITVADESSFIEESINSVQDNAIMGGVLAMVVLFVFLRNIRTTLIIGAAIPISIIATFVLIYFSGLTLNMLSMGGLALGIGMLVDNAIVVLENIFRHRQMNKDARKAAVDGTSEVGGAITASTITTLAVFVPVIFIQGLAAQLFTDLSLTVSFSLVASLAVSLSLVPLLSSRWLGATGTPSDENDLAAAGLDEADDDLQKEGPLHTEDDQYRLNSSDDGMEDYTLPLLGKAYTRFMHWALKRRFRVVASVIVIFIISALFIPRIGLEFLPSFDEGQISVSVDLPKGTALSETNRVISEIETFVSRIPEVSAVFAQAGSSNAPDSGSLTIHLIPYAERQRSTQDVTEEIRSWAEGIPGADIQVSSFSSFTGGGIGGAPVQIRLLGNDIELLDEFANQLVGIVRDVPGTRDVRTSLDEGRPELQVRVDRDRAGNLGLAVAQIASAVRTGIGGQTATVYRVGGEEIDIIVRLDEMSRQNINDIYQIPIGTPFGVVPLSEVATLEDALSPLAIERTSQSRVVAVNADFVGRDLGSIMRDIRAQLSQIQPPVGIEIEFGGEDEQMMEAFGDLGLALILAIVLVFAILASQFESLLQPFSIIFSIPFGFIGVIWGLLLTGRSLSVPAFIGVIMLAGIAVNNAIVLINFVNQLRTRGKERDVALIEGGRTRIRPILMTTLTTVLGMVPLALGIGEGSELQAPVATVVIGGLIVSTFLTLIIIPVIYSLLDDFGQWIRRISTRQPQKGVST